MSTSRPDASWGREKQIPRNTWNFNLSETRTRELMKRKDKVNNAQSQLEMLKTFPSGMTAFK